MGRQTPVISDIAFHVRYAETDKMGVVHHAAYLVWFEEGRSAFIRERGWSYAEIERSGYALAATELKARYLQPARYDQLLRVRTWIADCQTRAVTFECEVLDGETGVRLFSASIKLICLNAEGKPVRMPKAWSAWLQI